MPLGDYETFRHWSGKPRAWGPQESGWRAWFGGKIVDGLCEVLDEHLAVRRRGVPAAIGCVPWLSSEAVAETLLALSAFCVVIDKGTSSRRDCVTLTKGFPTSPYCGFATWRPPSMAHAAPRPVVVYA